MFRRAASYVDRVLKGEKLTVPQPLLATADEVIE